MMKNISIILVSSFCLLFSITASAQGIEIFSKDDADAVSSMKNTEWNNNVVAIQQSGGGQLKAAEYGYTCYSSGQKQRQPSR